MDAFLAISKITQRLYPTHVEGSKTYSELSQVILGRRRLEKIYDMLPAKLREGNVFTCVCLSVCLSV